MAAVTQLHRVESASLPETDANTPVRRFFRVAFSGSASRAAPGPALTNVNWRPMSVDSFFASAFAGRGEINTGGASCGDGSESAADVFGDFNWD